MDEKIQILGNKKYKAIEFKSTNKDDTSCNHCAFELGKCRGAIWTLGQCYIKNGEDITKICSISLFGEIFLDFQSEANRILKNVK